jgi:hypothetical protein
MAKVSFSKESLEGKPPVDNGLYELRLDGFEPKFSKDRQSVNLNPILVVVNNAKFNGSRVFDNLNTRAGWIISAFAHAFGQPLQQNASGGFDLPGDFNGPDDDPEKWQYVGPLSGMVGKAFVKQTTYQNKTNSKIDQWMCAVSGCQEKHPNGLAS